MANEIYVLGGSIKGDVYTIIFHIPVPAGATNIVGTTYRVLTSKHENTQSIIPDLDSAIQTKLTNGELYEYSFSFNRNPLLSDTADELKQLYNDMKPKILVGLQNKYEFYGKILSI